MRRKFEWFEPETEQTAGDVNVDRFEADMRQREEAATARTTRFPSHYVSFHSGSFSFITEAPVVRVENDVEDPYNVQPGRVLGYYNSDLSILEIYTATTVTTRQG